MKFFSLSELSIKAVEAFKRFPFTLVWAIVSTCISIAILERGGDDLFEQKLNLVLIMVLGISWLIGTQFYIEQFKKKNLWWIKIIVAAAVIGLYFTLPDFQPENYDHGDDYTGYIRWTLFFIAGHLTLFFAPFLTVWHPKAYWNYLNNMMIAIARSGLFSGILYLGLVLALVAVQFLFDADIKEVRFGQLFFVCLGIVNTWVYLSDFPKEIQHNIQLNFNKAIEVLVKFILIPLAFLYLIILYAYTIKIILQWELPKGWVSYLIIALAGLLFGIQFIIHPVRLSHQSRMIKRFMPIAFWLLLPLLLLFYIAIYTRVSAYGITEARYFLIVVAIFITGATVYLLFSRKKQLRYLPIALASFAMLGSFGFWGAFSVSKNSQLNQFKEVYNTFTQADSIALSSENIERFSSIAKYLDKRGSISEVKDIIGFDPKKEFPESSSWNIGDVILDSLGIQQLTYDISSSEYYTYNAIDSSSYNIKGYNFMNRINLNYNYESGYNTINEYSFYLKNEGETLLIKKLEEKVTEISLQDFAHTLPITEKNWVELPSEKLFLEIELEKVKFKLLFRSLSTMVKNDRFAISNCEAYVLLKELE